MVDFRPQNLKEKIVDNLQFRLARNVIKLAITYGLGKTGQGNTT